MKLVTIKTFKLVEILTRTWQVELIWAINQQKCYGNANSRSKPIAKASNRLCSVEFDSHTRFHEVDL